MDGQLAEVIALALHGSRWLSTPSASLDGLAPEATTFKYTASTEFTFPSVRLRRTRTLDGPAQWLEQLHQLDADGLWLVIPEAKNGLVDAHMLAGFANVGNYALLSTGPRGAIGWHPRWDVTNRGDPDHRIWTGRYTGVAAGLRPEPCDLLAARAELVTALDAIHEFALQSTPEPWAGIFSAALSMIDSASLQLEYYADMVPPGYLSLEGMQLMAAASRAWVFGGMGSWNDIYLDDDADRATHATVSKTLYDAVLHALVAAVNDGRK